MRQRHALGGSMSGARGVRSPSIPRSSTCNLRSAAFSNRAAEILGSLVAFANPTTLPGSRGSGLRVNTPLLIPPALANQGGDGGKGL